MGSHLRRDDCYWCLPAQWLGGEYLATIERKRRTIMGLMPANGSNPFTRLDKQSVVGSLKSCGSNDPDVLYAQKQQLVATAKQLRLLGFICIGVGAFMTVTVFLAIAGIPSMLFGWWLLRFAKQNTETVESTYTEFLASAH
jgi:predicted Rdx family selenoprotein